MLDNWKIGGIGMVRNWIYEIVTQSRRVWVNYEAHGMAKEKSRENGR